MAESGRAVSDVFDGYQGLVAAGVLPEAEWRTIAAGAAALLADAAQTGRPVSPAFEPLIGELVRRGLVGPHELDGVRFEPDTITTGIIRES